MEKNCVRMVYHRSLTTRDTATNGEEGGANAAVKSRKNKLRKSGEEDFINSISWPPKSYGCNFCKREFRSAQALGGHMNVHKIDKALLYSPQAHGHFTNHNLNLNPNPNPNPNPNHNLSSRDDVVFGRPFDRKASDLNPSSSSAGIAKPNVFEGAHWNKGEKVFGLDIEISSTNINTSTVLIDFKKDIDLELRLGYST